MFLFWGGNLIKMVGYATATGRCGKHWEQHYYATANGVLDPVFIIVTIIRFVIIILRLMHKTEPIFFLEK